MSWQLCPMCLGGGSIGYQGLKCHVCDGHKILDEATGQPPSVTQLLQNDKTGRPHKEPKINE